jgi:hypothetical protein
VGPIGQWLRRGVRRPADRLGRKKQVGGLVGCGPHWKGKVFPIFLNPKQNIQFKFDLQFKFEPTQLNPNKIQTKSNFSH